MGYTLITKNGKIMLFYIKATAELYRTINGGTIIESSTSESTPIPVKVEQ
jgi:hypothetical protein